MKGKNEYVPEPEALDLPPSEKAKLELTFHQEAADLSSVKCGRSREFHRKGQTRDPTQQVSHSRDQSR